MCLVCFLLEFNAFVRKKRPNPNRLPLYVDSVPIINYYQGPLKINKKYSPCLMNFIEEPI